ncbi:hypothetical protein D4764_09G0009820 [Takifugu flavidus]|uniref:Uncharacterized protein n=1 Tax=Takifugu flavidus TaxID=433684 RepID=A0A5C6MLB9_9TELE|nr:hypothetical protein D4764_09G0009820 [Takifugu flavidus]
MTTGGSSGDTPLLPMKHKKKRQQQKKLPPVRQHGRPQ